MFRKRALTAATSKMHRTGRANEKVKPGRSVLAEKVESSVIGVLRFLSGILKVNLRLMFSPMRWDRHLDATGRMADAVPPYTFLALSTFLATKALRVFLTTLLLILVSAERSCSPEFQKPLDYPKGSDIFQVPSLEDLIFNALPSVLLIVLVLYFASRILSRTQLAPGERMMHKFIYIVGFQYFLLTLVIAWSLPKQLYLENWKPIASGDFSLADGNSPLNDLGENWFYALSILLWPSGLLFIQLGKARLAATGKTKKMLGLFLMALIAFMLSCCTSMIGVVVAYPSSRSDVVKQAGPRPALELTMLRDDKEVGIQKRSFVVTNKTDQTLKLWLSSFKFDVRAHADYLFGLGVDSTDYPDRLMTLKPEESRMFKAEFSQAFEHLLNFDCGFGNSEWTRGEEYTKGMLTNGDGFPRWILGDIRYPTPEGTVGRLCIPVVNRQGKLDSVYAFVMR